MDQQAINQTEWANPANWSGPRWVSVYFSKRDSRVWVPKQIPRFGWTINLGRCAGVVWLIGFLLFFAIMVIGISVFIHTAA